MEEITRIAVAPPIQVDLKGLRLQSHNPLDQGLLKINSFQ